jgi:hypothetical protein
MGHREPTTTSTSAVALNDTSVAGFPQWPATPDITTTTLPTGEVGSPYTSTLAAIGGVPNYSWSKMAGVVPAGVALSPSGVLSGEPTISGSYTFTVQATDESGANTTRSLTIQVT